MFWRYLTIRNKKSSNKYNLESSEVGVGECDDYGHQIMWDRVIIYEQQE